MNESLGRALVSTEQGRLQFHLRSSTVIPMSLLNHLSASLYAFRQSQGNLFMTPRRVSCTGGRPATASRLSPGEKGPRITWLTRRLLLPGDCAIARNDTTSRAATTRTSGSSTCGDARYCAAGLHLSLSHPSMLVHPPSRPYELPQGVCDGRVRWLVQQGE
jgi:hypothetical protein